MFGSRWSQGANPRAPVSRPRFVEQWPWDRRTKGWCRMKKFLILLGILGLAIAIFVALKNRNGELEEVFE